MSRSAFLHRADAAYPFQNWQPFPSGAIVQVKNQYGVSKIDMSENLWWGYERELGVLGEAVITRARRLDRPKVTA
jgi:hypothetical protein